MELYGRATAHLIITAVARGVVWMVSMAMVGARGRLMAYSVASVGGKEGWMDIW